MPKAIPVEPEMLRSDPVFNQVVGVDKENNRVLGYVVAQEGVFKTGQGQFTFESLARIVELGNAAPRGLRVRFGHPTLSDDGLGKYLGRATNFRLDGDKVRADLKINATALKEPPQGGRPLGEYVMELASNDAGALSSSLVLKTDRIVSEDEDVPDVWLPTELMASDVVDEGDAVDNFLSSDYLKSLPTGVVYQATQLIDQQFKGQPRDVVESRLNSFLNRYLDYRYGIQDEHQSEKTQSQEKSEMSESDTNQVSEIQAELNSRIDDLTSKIESLTKVVEDSKKREAELAAREERSRKIAALCSELNLSSEDVNEFINDESLSFEDVRYKLLMKKINGAKPLEDEGSDDDDAKSKLSREYDRDASIHEVLGVSREEYINAALSKGPAVMSPKWAEEYREKRKKEAVAG